MFVPRSRLFFFRRASKKILDSCTTLTIKKRRSKARNFLLSVAKHNNKIVENKVSGLSGTMQFILFLPSDFFFLYLRIHKKSSDEVLRQSRRKTMTLNYNLVRTKSRTALLHYVINWWKSESIVVQRCYTLQLLNPTKRKNNKVGVKLHVRHKSRFFSPRNNEPNKKFSTFLRWKLFRDKVSMVLVENRRCRTPSPTCGIINASASRRRTLDYKL